MKHAFIERHQRIYPMCVQCPVLGVSMSGLSSRFAATPAAIPKLRDHSSSYGGAAPRTLQLLAPGEIDSE
jgi:hypothetical protein